MLDKDEVLRYLGFKKGHIVDKVTNDLIFKCSNELEKIAQPKCVYKKFSISCCDKGILINNSDIVLTGKNIFRHLKDCNECVIMAATLGSAVDRKIKALQITSVTEAVVFNAAATENIEEYCNLTQDSIEKQFGKTNFRFSPGYGDFPITQQKQIVNLLDGTRKIGLNVSDTFMLMPTKSVTAVMGLTDAPKIKNKCDNCLNKGCEFRCTTFSDKKE